jgi:hypothetical protein
MIESPYALLKYVSAKNLVYSSEEQQDTDFLFNIETISAFNHVEEMAKIAKDNLNGMVFGRVDFCGSLGLSRTEIEDQEVTDKVISVAEICRSINLDLVMGGAISIDALPNLVQVENVHLTRFETRKVVFKGDSVKKNEIKDGLLNAVHFELLWLLNKKDYYQNLTNEDNKRIEMLENRWKMLGREIL